jgi:hypothetical protein
VIDDVGEFVPKLVGAIIILVIGWFIARVVQRIAVTVLKKLKFDDLVDRSGLGGSLERAGYPDSGVLLARFLYFAVLLLALQLAINVFGESQVQDALDSLIALLPRIVIAAIIVVITGAIANAVRSLLEPMVADQDAGDLLVKGAVAAIWVVGVFAAIDQVGVAQDITETLFQALVGALALILVIKFGVGGVWAARDRFWPAVYDKLGSRSDSSSQSQQPPPTSGPSDIR